MAPLFISAVCLKNKYDLATLRTVLQLGGTPCPPRTSVVAVSGYPRGWSQANIPGSPFPAGCFGFLKIVCVYECTHVYGYVCVCMHAHACV